ncbi:ribonuclease P protein component [Candidatus Paracaedibacter symbiosus]|uniref:ribonuclease P protein component n=1 Tax=Candidatus Paracaedibacter symbiosus TaxID=244582 RepID=UPI00068BD879|nr:ribonuclease P protein component [Candidatus Paracaedibacter symbiosus]
MQLVDPEAASVFLLSIYISASDVIASPSKKRREFVKVAQEGTYVSSATLVVQRLVHDTPSLHVCRVGFTASKRVGNAVKRNKAKRRMREVIHLWAKETGTLPPYDLVLIAKPAAVTASFTKIQHDFKKSLANLQDAE